MAFTVERLFGGNTGGRRRRLGCYRLLGSSSGCCAWHRAFRARLCSSVSLFRLSTDLSADSLARCWRSWFSSRIVDGLFIDIIGDLPFGSEFFKFLVPFSEVVGGTLLFDPIL